MAMDCTHTDRGFSLLLVLLSLVVIALLGTTAVVIATSDAGAAGARANRAAALAAAEAGLAAYLANFSPSVDCAQPAGTVLLSGNAPALETNGETGADLVPSFTVTVGPVQTHSQSCNVLSRGILADASGNVMGEALLTGTGRIETRETGYGGQKDSGPRATGTDLAGRTGFGTTPF
jgi:Tfp pilus assembly protein PilX